jgi:hypothetical protein
MEWVVKYVTSKGEIVPIGFRFHDAAIELQSHLILIGYCAWVEQTDIIGLFGEEDTG